MDINDRGGWAQIFGGEASEPETSRPVNFYLLYLHLSPPLGVIHWNYFVQIFCVIKLKSPCGVVYEMLHLAVLIQYRLVTDGRAMTANTVLE